MSIDGSLTGLFQNAKDNGEFEEKMVQQLFDTKENLETKTEIQKPLSWSSLGIINNLLDELKLTLSADVLKSFTTLTFKYLISKNRMGRAEYLKALAYLKSSATYEDAEDMAKEMKKH